jgi:hypothetical protein
MLSAAQITVLNKRIINKELARMYNKPVKILYQQLPGGTGEKPQKISIRIADRHAKT